MKYIVFWEYRPEDFDKVIERFIAYAKEVEKHPDKYPKVLFPTHSMAGETKGIEIIEATSDQMTNEVLYWMGLVPLRFVPLHEAAKVVETYLKSK